MATCIKRNKGGHLLCSSYPSSCGTSRKLVPGISWTETNKKPQCVWLPLCSFTSFSEKKFLTVCIPSGLSTSSSIYLKFCPCRKVYFEEKICMTLLCYLILERRLDKEWICFSNNWEWSAGYWLLNPALLVISLQLSTFIKKNNAPEI